MYRSTAMLVRINFCVVFFVTSLKINVIYLKANQNLYNLIRTNKKTALSNLKY